MGIDVAAAARGLGDEDGAGVGALAGWRSVAVAGELADGADARRGGGALDDELDGARRATRVRYAPHAAPPRVVPDGRGAVAVTCRTHALRCNHRDAATVAPVT